MGLLSDPEYGSVKWVKLLRKINFPLCCLCYVGSIVWFLMLAHRDFNNETYFSENALLPGLVTNEFNGEQSANKYFTEFLQELEDKYDDRDDMPVPWLVGKMSQIGLEVYTHNFSLNYPLGQGQIYKGINVYGILRAPRSSSLEALVLSVPYRSLSNHQKGTAAGIALMLAFAEFARPQNYWAKDIIFLITEHEQLGMQAWLEAYHGLQRKSSSFYTTLGSFWQPDINLGKLTKGFEWLRTHHSKSLDPGVLKGRSGSIQAAINLEFQTPKIKYIEVKVEGLNGQLPNLDLVNLVHKLCVKSGIHHSYKNSYSWIRSRNVLDEWVNNIWTMFGMASAQIAGVPNGNHGLFHRFGIEAVTLEGREFNDPAGDPPRVQTLSTGNFFRLGSALESILRSLNNLLERFHQSYFFYMLAATNRYISIGQYMPTLCLLCGAMLVRALFLWVTLQLDDELTETQSDEKNNKDMKVKGSNEVLKDTESKEEKREADIKDEEKEQLVEDAIKKKKSVPVNFNIVSVGVNYLLVHVLGLAVMNSPQIFNYIGATYFDQPSEVSVFYGLISLSVFLIFLTPFMLRFPSTSLTFQEMSIINILLLIELATACLAIGMHNYPLGLCIAVVYTPLALLVEVVSDNRQKSAILLFLKRLLCILLQPLFAVSIALILYAWIIFPEEGIFGILSRGRDAVVQAVMFSIVDSMIYGNWLFKVATNIILPTWILFWQILCNRVTN